MRPNRISRLFISTAYPLSRKLPDFNDEHPQQRAPAITPLHMMLQQQSARNHTPTYDAATAIHTH